MSLAEAVDRVPVSDARRASCCIGRILATVDAADRALLEEWLAPDSGRHNPWIAAVLTADGHRNARGTGIGLKAVQGHRSKVCGCFL